MISKALRDAVFEANQELVRRDLVIYTFGNVSGFDPEQRLVVIKPSGVPYETMTPADLVVTDLDGKTVEGTLRPSSDLPTHLVLYRALPGIGGVVHTHSPYATAWAQSGREIPCLGTTHADYYPGNVPITTPLTDAEIEGDYEANTGLAIVRRIQGTEGQAGPGVLVSGHGPFVWGKNAAKAVENAVTLEEIARMALFTLSINPKTPLLGRAERNKHFHRKHGPGAHYGQNG
jgi:L-ribulose-5-phosphate 4-epimerase